jgi:cbb3-type cytochrome oxidase subunit 3
MDGFIFMTIIFFMVYVFVWLMTLWFHKRDENQINKALDDIRDEE